MTVTVCCLLVRGPVPYTAEYVVRLKRMVASWLNRPHQFVCVTDGSVSLPADIETVPIPLETQGEGLGYWAKLQMFNRDHGFTGRMLYLDLDTLVVGALDALIDFPAPLALAMDPFVESRASIIRDRNGRAIVRKFNASAIVWDAGTQDFLWDRWTPAEMERLSTDQDWIAEQARAARAMPLEWFPRLSQVQPPWPEDARVVLCKKPKNHEAAKLWPWFERAWSGQ